jgi:hypothetical protein
MRYHPNTGLEDLKKAAENVSTAVPGLEDFRTTQFRCYYHTVLPHAMNNTVLCVKQKSQYVMHSNSQFGNEAIIQPKS